MTHAIKDKGMSRAHFDPLTLLPDWIALLAVFGYDPSEVMPGWPLQQPQDRMLA